MNLNKWLRLAIFNLLIVAFLGLVMRYKIAFSLPFIVQKFFLNAHSHFAFAGWITQSLMTFIASYIEKNKADFSLKKYNKLLFANLITAYGMLFCFPFEGYGSLSVIFSTLSIFVSYAFAIVVWRDLNTMDKKGITPKWIKAGLAWSVLSSIGPYTLAYMMATKNFHQNIYLASIYFYLHFQYNGWFFFTCIGLFMNKLPELLFPARLQKNIFWAFTFACVPAYFLSALWLPIPSWVYVMVVLAAFAQVIAWGVLCKKLIANRAAVFAQQSKFVTWLFVLPAIALSIKLILQLGSTIPALSTWAFGFRPIIIGYLHLVFLGIFSLFILAYSLRHGYIQYNSRFARGAWIFISGIILNEVLLMFQGLDAIIYTSIPYVNELLFAAAIVMFIGVLIMNVKSLDSKRDV